MNKKQGSMHAFLYMGFITGYKTGQIRVDIVVLAYQFCRIHYPGISHMADYKIDIPVLYSHLINSQGVAVF